MEWINEYIGKPWIIGGQGPDGFDCFGLVRNVLSKHFNIELPDIGIEVESLIQVIRAIKGHDGWLLWEKIERPEHGCLVKLYRQSEPDHIGIYLSVDGGGILHSCRDNGVQFDLPFFLSAMGWKRLEYYRHRGNHA